jgi:hypothetical protein
MPDPFLERLSRFTPDAGRLDRDALLFAAGRSSARPNCRWVAIASVLASTQVLSLAVLWPRANSNRPTDGSAVAVATLPAPSAANEPSASEAVADSALWRARWGLLEPDSEYRPAAGVTFIETEPPLRASRPIRRSLLN